MALSSDLISQFVKITNDNTKSDKETIVYGTTVEYDGKMYVRIDGSELLTPVETTAGMGADERVTIMIKNHSAVVTGNISSPSARSSEVITVDKLNAQAARIDSLVANNVTINETLEAHTADIEYLEANMITADNIDAKFVKAEQLEATNAEIDKLAATHATFETATTNRLNAAEGKIADLDAIKADIKDLDADVADINTLIFGSATGDTIQTSFANAVIAQLGDARIKSAMIQDISAGKITSGDIITNNVRIKSEDGSLIISDETMQISDDTRVRVQIGKDAANDYSINVWDQNGNLMFSKGGITDAAIKDAIIRNDMVSDTANISAHKLDIDSLFEEINKDGSNTIKSTKVYLDDEKQTLDVAFKGLTTDVNDLGETVSSQGTQISAVQGQISSKVWQQDINTAKNEMSTQYSILDQKVDGVSATVASNTSAISKKADSSTVTNVTNRVATLETNLSGFQSSVSETYATKTEVDNIEIGGRNLVTGTSDEWAYITVPRYAAIITGRKHCSEYGLKVGDQFTYSLELNPLEKTGLRARLDFYSNVSGEDGKTAVFGNDVINGSPGKSWLTAIVPEGCEYITLMIGNCYMEDEITSTTEQYRKIKIEKGNRSTDWTRAPEDVEGDITALQDRISSAETVISQNAEAITLTATKTEVSTAKSEAISAASSDATTKANNALSSANTNTSNLLKNYSTTSEMDAAIELKANAITSSVSETYATKTALTTTNNNVSAAQTTANEAKTNAATAQSTANSAKNSINNLEIGGRNLLTDDLITLSELKGGGEYTYSKTSKGQTTIFSSLTLEPGQYMYSLYMKRTEGVDVARIRLHKNGVTSGYFTPNTTDGEWAIVIIPITVTSSEDVYGSQIYNHNFGDEFDSTVSVKKTKLERGDKATDWSPAPEDMATVESVNAIDERLVSAESSITQLSNKITANVTETTNLGTRMSTVEQTASGLTTRLGTVESTANAAKTNAATAQTTANNAAKTAANYLNFSSGGLVVGDMTASTLGKNVLIDSDSVDIRNGTTTLASFGANTVTLGRNSEDSVIDLCDGAGRISANTAEAATSFPNRNAILIDSQEIETESVRFVASTSNKYGATSTPSIVRGTELYMQRSSSSGESCARLKAEHKTTSSGAYTNAGVSAMTYDAASTTRLLVYASDSANSTYNNINVYPTKTVMNKNLTLNGTVFTGKNKVLWSGTYYMSDSQTATLSEAISAQANGIVLVWSYYTNGAADNSNFQMTYIPKHFITLHAGKGVVSTLTNSSTNMMCSKYTYVSDTKITGYAGNDDASAVKDTGITTIPKNFVLRYVIGV